MSKKLVSATFALALVGFAAACAPKPEPVDIQPITTEPVYTGKFGGPVNQ